MPKSNLPKFTLHIQTVEVHTVARLGVERMIWRETLDMFLSANNDILRNGRIRQTRGTAFRVHKVSWRPLGGAVLIRGPWASLWLWIWLFYGSRERATYFRMPPCLKNATSMSFSKRVVTLKLFPGLVWKQRQTWTLDVAWTKIFMYKQIAI